MKANKYMAILVASLSGALSPGVNATVPSIPGQNMLAGWYAFDDTTGPEGADQVAGGIIASVSKGTVASQSTLGSTDQYYGPSWDVPSLATPNGRINTQASNDVIFSIKQNFTGISPTKIEWLLFDANKPVGGVDPSITVTYQINGGGYLTIPAIVAQPVYSDSNDYTDFQFNLTSLGLSLNSITDQIDFKFVTDVSARFDNILFSGQVGAVPEPGSMLAIGCFLGSGLLIRRNRRA